MIHSSTKYVSINFSALFVEITQIECSAQTRDFYTCGIQLRSTHLWVIYCEVCLCCANDFILLFQSEKSNSPKTKRRNRTFNDKKRRGKESTERLTKSREKTANSIRRTKPHIRDIVNSISKKTCVKRIWTFISAIISFVNEKDKWKRTVHTVAGRDKWRRTVPTESKSFLNWDAGINSLETTPSSC